MIVGVLKEIRAEEYRVALSPAGAEELTARGHTVLVESCAGAGGGFSDAAYREAGAEILPGAKLVWERAELALKVKEPQPEEFPFLRPDLTLFTYFHFAASLSLTRAILDSGIVAIAYETVETDDGGLPLLIPMSEVAGRMAVQQGAKYLEREHGGRGVLLGGVPGTAPAHVVVIGGGAVGSQAARMAAGLGARVTLLDVDLKRLRHLAEVAPANVTLLMSDPVNLRRFTAEADVLISGVLVRGGKAPRLVTREMVKGMKKGAVVVDVAIDQGGSLETSRPTTHADPIYVVDGVIHYCVTNMPGVVPLTSTQALTAATAPYVIAMADRGIVPALQADPTLARGVEMAHGKLVNRRVAEAFDLPWVSLEEALGQ